MSHSAGGSHPRPTSTPSRLLPALPISPGHLRIHLSDLAIYLGSVWVTHASGAPWWSAVVLAFIGLQGREYLQRKRVLSGPSLETLPKLTATGAADSRGLAPATGPVAALMSLALRMRSLRLRSRQRVDEELEGVNRALDYLMANSVVAIVTWKGDGEVARWNSAAERMLGWKAADAIGYQQPLQIGGGNDTLLDLGRQQGTWAEYRLKLLAADGREVPVRAAISPLHNQRGKRCGTIAVLMNPDEDVHGSAVSLRSVADHSFDGIILADSEGRFLSSNAAARRILALSSDEMRTLSLDDIVVPPRAGRLIRKKAATTPFRGEITLGRKGGSTFRAELSVAAFADRSGQVRLGIFVRDVAQRVEAARRRTELLRLEQQARLAAEAAHKRAGYLAQVNGELTKSLDYAETLQRIADLSVQGFADYCVVFTRTAGNTVMRRAVAHANPLKAEMAKQMAGGPLPLRWDSLITTTLASGHSLLLSGEEVRIEDEVALNSEHRTVLRALDLSSAMIVPLRARGKIHGAISFFKAGRTGAPFSNEDLHVAESMAHSAAFAIDNARLYKQARRASRAREQILTVVAHDLRSPLGAISISSELLADFTLAPESRAYHLEIIQRATSRMSRLIQDLVDVSNIDRGRLSLDPYRQRVLPTLTQLCELFQARADARSVGLVLEETDPNLHMYADRYRVIQILSNLLENAFTFVGRGGEVRVGAKAAGDVVAFSVSDNGPGIEEANLGRIFDRFWRGNASDSRGAGLGLAICQGIVETHGGRIWATSTPGEGTCFHFTLPMHQAPRILLEE